MIIFIPVDGNKPFIIKHFTFTKYILQMTHIFVSVGKLKSITFYNFLD